MLRPVALALLTLSMLSGCAVVSVTSAVVGTGVTLASTAVDVGVAAGKGVVYVGKAALGSDDPK